MIELEPAIKSLASNKVEFIIIGGVAITAYGSAYLTQDLDFCYSRTRENLKKIVAALTPFKPKLRGFPKDLPFFFDEQTLQSGTNFTFATEIGDIDMLGEVSGVGNYEVMKKGAVEMRICGIQTLVISLDDLIKAKRAAGRTKDLLVLPELEALREVLTDED